MLVANKPVKPSTSFKPSTKLVSPFLSLTMMKKLVCSSIGSKSPFSNALRVFYYSTETLTSPSSQTSDDDTLYKRVSAIGDTKVSIAPVLDQWVKEGKPVPADQLRTLIKQLRTSKLFSHALEVSHWMSDRRYIVLIKGDIALRLSLVYQVHGLGKSEEYFSNIPEQLKDFQTYIALLNCYGLAKSIEKAEILMQKMRALGFAKSSLSYKVLLNLYSKEGEYEKLDALVDEMTTKGIRLDKITFNLQLSAYAHTKNIDGMEKIMSKMEADPDILVEWPTYITAARGYIKAGLMDKAVEMLSKSEELITNKKSRHGYETLFYMYASITKKDDMYRMWDICKSAGKLHNSVYHCMIASLWKMDDIVSAEEIFEKWETGDTPYHFRFPNMMISGYCRIGLMEKAEKLLNNAIEKGEEPLGITWECMATGYIKADRMAEGMEAMKKAISVNPEGKPQRDTLAACLGHLKERGDSDGMNELASLFGVSGPFSTDDCERLLNLVCGSESETGRVREMDGDFSENEDTNPFSESRLESVS